MIRSLPCALALAALLTACSSSSSNSVEPAATASATVRSAVVVPDVVVSATTAAPVPTTIASTSTSTSTSTTAASTTTASTTTASTTTAPATGPLTVQQLLDLGRPIVLAHAGGEDEHPHSTPYAYAESAKAGVDMLDFDVQLTRDGVLVVQHDDDTGRTTNANVKIADTDYADLAALDNAYWFTAACTCTGQPDSAYTLRGVRTGAIPPPAGYTPDDFIIPRFEDIVERFPNLPVNIEIKGNGDSAVAAAKELARILTAHDLLDNAVVTSFDDTVVDAFHAMAPTVEVTPGLNLSSAWILGGTPLPAGMRILQLPPEFENIDVLTPKSIAASHAAGYVIWVWPNNRDFENTYAYTGLLQLGMDGLNINFPDEGVAAVKAFDPASIPAATIPAATIPAAL